MLMALDIDRAARDRAAPRSSWSTRAVRGNRVGVIGYCMGGELAL